MQVTELRQLVLVLIAVELVVLEEAYVGAEAIMDGVSETEEPGLELEVEAVVISVLATARAIDSVCVSALSESLPSKEEFEESSKASKSSKRWTRLCLQADARATALSTSLLVLFSSVS